MHIHPEELNAIKGLMHYLNQGLDDRPIDVEARLVDANGEYIGTVKYVSGAYVLDVSP